MAPPPPTERYDVLRVERPSLLPSEDKQQLIQSSTEPLKPRLFVREYLENIGNKRKRRILEVLKFLKNNVRMLPDDSNRFVNMVNFKTSISSLHELLLFFVAEAGEDKSVLVSQPPDAMEFLALLKNSRVPAKLLRMVKK